MAKKTLKEHMAGAQVANMINDIMIEKSLDRLENYELNEKERTDEVTLLRRGMECRDKFQEGKEAYKEIKAARKGFIVGWASATVGAVIGILGPKAFTAVKNHFTKEI